MARGRAKWKKAFDLKPALGAGMAWLEVNAPAVTKGLRYHSLQAPVPPSYVIEDLKRPFLFHTQPYQKSYHQLRSNNVDGNNPKHQGGDIRLVSAICPSVLIHGHFMQPIDTQTGHLLALSEGRIPWGLTYPFPTLKPIEKINGFVAAIPPINNYYHVLVDYLLPVVSAILRHPAMFNKPITFLLNRPSIITEFMSTLLRDAGFDTHVQYLTGSQTLVAEHYIFAKASAPSTEHGYAFYPELKMLDPLIAAYTDNIDVPESLVIQRTKTRLRNVLNQDQMLSMLSARKFTPVVFDWSNLLFQIACFRKAKKIISVHGAALTNLCWGTGHSVLEIFPDNARKTTYLHIASQNGWRYQPAFGSAEQSNQDFSVDMNDIEAALDAF
ncbi:MAG: glycosyltransferase family 61 protein [Methylocystaceae bacterium]|nr:glycosyltransferase family 61 protein [Methylocystaceae bacterium]